jgi:hypothetical protein
MIKFSKGKTHTNCVQFSYNYQTKRIQFFTHIIQKRHAKEIN